MTFQPVLKEARGVICCHLVPATRRCSSMEGRKQKGCSAEANPKQFNFSQNRKALCGSVFCIPSATYKLKQGEALSTPTHYCNLLKNMERKSSLINIQKICLVDNESVRGGGTLFRRDSSLSNKSDYERAERRLSLRNLFSKAAKNDAASTPPGFHEEEHLKLFKSKEFQAYLKEHNIFTTAGVQVIFQQFLHYRNTDLKSTNEKVEAAQVYRRKNSGDSLLDIASRCAMPGSNRRSTNGSDNTFHESENSLDTSMWSLDDSCRKSYLTVIR
eukprot:scaffold14590_cov151-Skeletonema_dohrnii-CCMP3373.AAC.4